MCFSRISHESRPTLSFALARREQLAGIVLLFQANPDFKHFSEGLAHQGFKEFLETLRWVRTFGDVVFIVGAVAIAWQVVIIGLWRKGARA